MNTKKHCHKHRISILCIYIYTSILSGYLTCSFNYGKTYTQNYKLKNVYIIYIYISYIYISYIYISYIYIYHIYIYIYIIYIYIIYISYMISIPRYPNISQFYIPLPCLGPERFRLLQGAQGLGQAQRTLQGDRLGQRQQRLASGIRGWWWEEL